MAAESRRTRWLALALLVALCAAVFARTLTFQFVWDDKSLIVGNPFLRQSDTIWRAFTHDFWQLTAAPQTSGFYRPLVLDAYWIEHHVFGDSPAGFHFVDVVLHVVCVLLVFQLFVRMRIGAVPAVIGAAVFAVHPVQTTAVGNIASQTDLLATTFVLAGCLVWCRTDRIRWIAPALLALALLAKESAIVGPLLALGCARIVRGEERVTPRLFVPLAAVIPYAILRTIAIQGFGSDGHSAPFRGAMQYAHYTARLIVPIPESPISHQSPPPLALAIASLLTLVGGVVLLARSHQSSRLRFGVAWFLVALVPVAELVPLGARQNDLLLYLPLIGVSLVVAHLVEGRRRLAWAASAAIVACAIVSAIRIGIWENSFTLWREAVLLDPNEPAALLNLGTALRERGDRELGCDVLLRVRDAIAARPDTDVEVRANYNIGNCRREAGDPSGALTFYQRAYDLSGGAMVPAANNLAVTLSEIGRLDDALTIARVLVATDDHIAPSWRLLAAIAIRAGRVDEAEAALRRALSLAPDDAESKALLTQIRTGRNAPAVPPRQ